MTVTGTDRSEPFSVALVAPLPPPFGGMAIQAVKLREKLEDEGVKVTFIASNPPLPTALRWCNSLPVVRTVIRLLVFLPKLALLRSVDVVHVLAASHLYFFVVVLPALCAARLYGKRVLLNYRGGEAEAFFARHRWLVGLVLRLPHAITVPSPFLHDVFRRSFGIDPHIQPNLADLERFSFRLRRSFRPRLVVSRQLEPLYGHETIIRAFAVVRERFPDALLTVVGGGSLEPRLKALCRELGLAGVEFVGPVSHERLSGIYEECDIMINASVADNFPGAIIEAFICGLPVITSSVGGIPFLVQDGKTGILVAAGDHQAMAAEVVRLTENPGDAAPMVLAAREFADRYRWANIRDVIFSLYEIEPKAEMGGCRGNFVDKEDVVSAP